MKASSAHCRRGYFFFLDRKEAKNQVRANAAPPALPVLNAFLDARRLTSREKAKPAFPPYARPARSDIPRALFNRPLATRFRLLTPR
jgi:hypothetical protein